MILSGFQVPRKCNRSELSHKNSSTRSPEVDTTWFKQNNSTVHRQRTGKNLIIVQDVLCSDRFDMCCRFVFSSSLKSYKHDRNCDEFRLFERTGRTILF